MATTTHQSLTADQLLQVNGGINSDFFTAAGGGGALGGALATNSLAGVAAGSALGLAAAGAFTLGYATATATAAGAGSAGSAFGSWLYDLLHQ